MREPGSRRWLVARILRPLASASRAVILVAGMAIPEVAREVVLERVVSLLGTPAAQKQNHK